MAIYNASKAICYARGDDEPITFKIEEDSVAKDITGFTFEFALNTELNPGDATNEVFRLVGVITDAAGGLVQFEPTTVQTDLAITSYYYDLQRVDGAGKIRTLLKSDFDVEQDINKT